MDEQELKRTVKTTDPKQGVEFIIHDDEPEPELVGQVLNERYKIISEIGSGGMGKVYKAEFIALNKIQAVKVLHRHLSGDSQSLQRFQVEAKAASSLRHENLLTVTDYGVTETRAPYIVMDYVEGESLSFYLEQHEKLSVADFITVFSQVVKGLAHAHEKGVIHRDLKPSNIMLSFNAMGSIESVRIVDFGIAKILPNDQGAAQHLTQTGEIFGSPLYMSPEQCRGGKIDFRSDIYSLGCVMFEALTGAVPIKGENAVETLYKHMSETAPTISQTYPQLRIPTSLEKIVSKCMANDPEQRYQNASQLSDDLATVKADDAVLPSKPAQKKAKTPISLESGPRKKVIFNPAAVLIFLVVFVAALGGVFFFAGNVSHTAPHTGAEKYEPVTARDHFQKAYDLYIANNDLEAARREAEQAYKLTSKDSDTELYAQIRNLAGEIDFAQLKGMKEPSPFREKEAEELLKDAITCGVNPPKIALQDFEDGLPKYRRDLADFYMYEQKWDFASEQLTEVLKGADKSIDELKLTPGADADLLRQFITLFWAQGGEHERDAARYTIALSMPDSTPNLTPAPSSDFAGHWTFKQVNAHGPNGTKLQDYFFDADVKNDGSNHITAKVHTDKMGFDLQHNFQAAGTFKDATADISWDLGGNQFKGKLYRVGDYILWRGSETANPAQARTEEVLSRPASGAGTGTGAKKSESKSADATSTGGVEDATGADAKSEGTLNDHAAPMLLNPGDAGHSTADPGAHTTNPGAHTTNPSGGSTSLPAGQSTSNASGGGPTDPADAGQSAKSGVLNGIKDGADGQAK